MACLLKLFVEDKWFTWVKKGVFGEYLVEILTPLLEIFSLQSCLLGGSIQTKGMFHKLKLPTTTASYIST